MPRVCLVAFATSLLSFQSWAAPISRPLGIEAALTVRDFARHLAMNVSPDGRLVAYTVARPSNLAAANPGGFTDTGAPSELRATDVWITDLQSGRTENLTNGKGANWGNAWSPDGSSLAFYSDRDGVAQVWVWQKSTGLLLPIKTAQVRAHGLELQWTPDGKQLLIGLQPAELKGMTPASRQNKPCDESAVAEPISKPTVHVFRSGTGNSDQGYDHSSLLKDLVLVDVVTGSLRVVARNVRSLKALVSPDGHQVAFVEVSERQVRGSHIRLYDLTTVRLDTSEARTLLHEQPLGSWGLDFSWSPDSQTIAVRSGGHEFGDVYRVSLTGSAERVTATPHPPFKGTPVWDDAGRSLYLLSEDALWSVSMPAGAAHEVARLPGRTMSSVVTTSPNRDRIWLRNRGRTAILVASSGAMTGFYEVDLGSGRAHALLEEERHYVVDDPDTNIDNVIATPDLRAIVYAAEDAQRPPDLWLLAGSLDRPRRITSLNPDISAIRMGQRRVLSWKGGDGRPYNGILLLPSDYRADQQYPLVTYVYPIDVLPYANKFGTAIGGPFYNLQLLATRGYAVLFSGATVQPTDVEPMRAVPAAVLPGIDHVIQLGIADPSRLGVFGASAGGYSVLALIVQSTRFKAAVSHAGPGNLLSLYGDLQASGYSHGLAVDEATFKMPDHPWNERDRYIRNSPWFFLDKIQTPLLLLHGTDDTATIVTQANEMFVGLRRLQKPVEYARYDGEDHGFSALVNATDAAARYIRWFDCHLKPVLEKSEQCDVETSKQDNSAAASSIK